MRQILEKKLPRFILGQRDEILEIAAQYGAHNVRIFGSVARGEARPDSDLDLLVDMESGRSLFDLAGLLYDLRKFLNREVERGRWVKTTPVWAEVAEQAGSVKTKEGSTRYAAGDYLVFNEADGGDPYAVSRAKFEALYELDD
jgi:predicted nucleotidyltransferase